MPRALTAVLALTPFVLIAACDSAREVSHPFYIMKVPDSAQSALYRCPDGPGKACAIDGLPGAGVTAAGTNSAYVVVERVIDGQLRYYYFARIPNEVRGWGDRPKVIEGPIDRRAFDEAKARLALPDLSVKTL